MTTNTPSFLAQRGAKLGRHTNAVSVGIKSVKGSGMSTQWANGGILLNPTKHVRHVCGYVKIIALTVGFMASLRSKY